MENKDGKHWRDICVQLLKMKETEVETKQSESDKVEITAIFKTYRLLLNVLCCKVNICFY